MGEKNAQHLLEKISPSKATRQAGSGLKPTKSHFAGYAKGLDFCRNVSIIAVAVTVYSFSVET